MMAVTVHVTSVIQQVVNGQREFLAEGKSVGELIDNIEQEYPGFATKVMDEQGDLRRFVNVYLNDEDVRYLGGKDTPLQDGDSVSFLPALAGGL
jgi:sulfur-carrier protein